MLNINLHNILEVVRKDQLNREGFEFLSDNFIKKEIMYEIIP